MMRIASLLLPAAVVALPVAREQALQQQAPFATIPLVTFDGNKATTQPWRATNDPVMGGVSHSTFTVGTGSAEWSGEVKIVPKLHAPGFCTATCGGYHQQPVKLPDISGAQGLLVTLRNKLPGGLASFKVSMDAGGSEREGQFEARFNTTAGGGWTTHFLPFTTFTRDSRGQPTGSSPTKAQLKAISGLGFNQDGVAGKFDLEIKEIAAGSPGGGGGGGKTLDLVTFNEGDKTNYAWTDLNDPVMGGRSTSTFKVEGGKGIFDGVCRIVPQLKAPGFCNAEAKPGLLEKIADASSFIEGGLEIEYISTGNLTQFKAAFGSRAEHDFGSYKADFAVVGDGTRRHVRIPFPSFSNKWSSSTGEPTVKCDEAHPRVCPTAHSLATIGAIGVWAEGFAGQFHLELTAIRAYLGGPAPGAAVCRASEFCCPDAKHCLTPVPGKTCGAAQSCAASETCCPLTKICVNVGAACKSPCADQGSYCCPDAKHCLTPTNPGHLCDPADKSACRASEVCCPLIKECVSVGAACTPSDDKPDWIV